MKRIASISALIIVITISATAAAAPIRLGDTAAGWGVEAGIGGERKLALSIGYDADFISAVSGDTYSGVVTGHTLAGGVRYYFAGQRNSGFFVDGSLGLMRQRSDYVSAGDEGARTLWDDYVYLRLTAGVGYNLVLGKFSVAPRIEYRYYHGLSGQVAVVPLGAGVGIAVTF